MLGSVYFPSADQFQFIVKHPTSYVYESADWVVEAKSRITHCMYLCIEYSVCLKELRMLLKVRLWYDLAIFRRLAVVYVSSYRSKGRRFDPASFSPVGKVFHSYFFCQPSSV